MLPPKAEPIPLRAPQRVRRTVSHAPKGFPEKLKFPTLGLIVMGLVGCGGGFEGVYEPAAEDGSAVDGFFERIEFRSGDRVEITFMGTTKEGSYEVEGDRVRVTMSGETQILRIDEDGCIDGGGLVGRYCRSGRSSGSSKVEPEKDKGPSGTYVARDGNDIITLEFTGKHDLRLSITDGNDTSPAMAGTYSMRGDAMEIRLPEADVSFKLTYQGDALTGEVEGDSVRFVRR